MTIYTSDCDGSSLSELICGTAIDLNADPTFGQTITKNNDPVTLHFESGRNDEGTGFKAEVCCTT